ncbi:MAG: hypothetical protein ACE5HU_07735, partial [Acidobacteriota bacterium]
KLLKGRLGKHAAPDGRGGTWNAAGDIVFSPGYRDPLWRVPSSGGEPVQVTRLDAARNEETHRYPRFLPDGRHFLFLARVRGQGRGEQTAIYVGSLDSEERQLLFHVDSNAAYVSGHLLFVRDRTLMAQPFDPDRLEFTADAVPLAESVRFDQAYSRGIFSVSDNGVLVYQTGRGQTNTQLAMFDGTGEKLDAVGETGDYPDISLSRDGGRAALSIVDPTSSNWDIWLHDMARNVRTRFTFDASIDCCAAWSPDGTFLVFSSDRKGHFDLYRKDADGSGTAEILYESEGDVFHPSISPDGRWIIYTYTAAGSATKFDLWALPVEQPGDPVPIVRTDFQEGWGDFSPDGKWIAYTSDESGREEVYIMPFPEPGGKWQVTTAGGTQPRWKKDQTGVFFLAPTGEMMIAPVTVRDERVEVGDPRSLFGMERGASIFRVYDVAADGTRFLINTAVEQQAGSPLTLVVNWTADLQRD